MPLQYKQSFRRLNLVSHPDSLRPTEYTYLKNAVLANSPGGDGLAVMSVLGNSEMANADLPEGTNTVVARWEDKINNRIFFLIHNDTAANHTLYRLDTNGTFTRVLRGSVLDLALGRHYDMWGIGDIVFWCDGVTEVKKVDTAKAIAGGYYTPLASEITLLKPPPSLPLTWTLGYDGNTETNLLAGNYFQFFYRYIYENYDYSVFSPASKTTNSWALPTDTAVRLCSSKGNITLSGNQNIDGMTTAPGDRVLVVAQTDPINNGIYVTAAGSWSRAADFPAGTTSDRTVYVTDGELDNYKTVWRVRSLNPGTIATYAQKLDGPNYATITRPGSAPATVIGIEYAVRVNGGNELIVYRKEKAGAFTSNHTFYNDSYLFSVPDSEAFRWHDSIWWPKSMYLFKNRLFFLNSKEGYTHSTTQKVSLTLVQIEKSTIAATRVVNAAKPGSRVSIGVVFKDIYGRHSSVQCINTVSIPNKATLFYKIRVETTGIPASIPDFATHFSIVATKPSPPFLQGYTQDIYYYKRASDGSITYSKSLSSFDADGTAIDIGSLPKRQRGYTFNQGDRIKLFDLHSITDTSETSTVHDIEILGQDGRFIYTKVLGELNLRTTRSDTLPFEIYTPTQTTQETFYEIGHSYTIAGFQFSGPFTLEGDVEVTEETPYSQDGIGYNNSDPFANDYTLSTTIGRQPVYKMNAWDRNSTVWVTQASGRGTIQSESVELLKDNFLRFSQQFIEHSAVFGLNTFFSADEYPLQIINGPGTRLYAANNVLVAVSEQESTAIYIGDAFVRTSDASEFLAKTDNVIGDDREYFGGFGSIHPESVCSDDQGRLYYYDMTKGVIVRRSNDGLTPISELYWIGQWIRDFSRDNFANRASMRFPGGYDPVYKLYLLSAIAANGTHLWTIGFHEADEFSESPYWVGFFDYKPILYSKLNGFLISFNGGKVWMHNNSTLMNFYGEQKTRTLEFTTPMLGSKVNLLEGISINSDEFWDGEPTDVVVQISNNGTGVIRSGPGQQETNIMNQELRLRQGVYQSAIFRDINTPQPFPAGQAKYKGEKMRGQVFKFSIYGNKTDDPARLRSVTVLFTPSPHSYH